MRKNTKHLFMMKFIHSFGYALSGLWYGIVTQRNLRIHFTCLLLVLGMGWYFSLSHTEWLLVAIAAFLVLSAELFNTAIEQLCDVVEANIHPGIKRVKDIAAAAVLLSAMAALVTGAVVFIPKILVWIKKI